MGAEIVARFRSLAIAARAQASPWTAAPAFDLSPGTLDYGVGIHGERGTRTIDHRPVEELVRQMTDDLVEALPAGQDKMLVVVNGLGATTSLLVSALTEQQPQPADEALVSWSFAQSPSCALALYDTRLRLRRANEHMERALAPTEDDMRGLRANEAVDSPAGGRQSRACCGCWRPASRSTRRTFCVPAVKRVSTPGRPSCRR